MQLFHWNGVRNEWHSGNIVVLAQNLKQARQLACEALDNNNEEPNDDQVFVMTNDPKVYAKPAAIVFHGSA